ncbi:MAG: septum formation family protein [Nocardioides sp.]|uniref:septum formation family protein n=1 Tax=Nocardioides sp. TaxID=35761 RepID=UPI0039E3B192
MRTSAAGAPAYHLLRFLAGLISLGLVATLTGCGGSAQGSNSDPDQVDTTTAPESGACRMLTPDDVALTSNATGTVPCTEPHTAQTFLVDSFPTSLADATHDDPELAAHAYPQCRDAFASFTGGDESLVMRSVVSWVWFGPSEQAWEDGARWFRCDLVGGGPQSKKFVTLPTEAEGLLSGRPEDEWLACAHGESFDGSVKVPCSEDHNWRAVTTIKLGEPDDPYPGDKVARARTQDYCSDSVGAWLGYPVQYDFAYTWFHETEWKAGNRRSVCWAATDQ